MQQVAISSLEAGVNTIDHFANPELDLDYFTCGLLKYIPLDINLMIFSGGLLFDAYYCLTHNTKSSYDLNKLKDIDLFLFGPEKEKELKFNQIVKNLKTTYGDANVKVGCNRSVISIFICGIPRIVQLVLTNYSNAQEIIDNFDMAHVAMYYSDKGFYASPFSKMSVQLKQVLPNPKCGKRAKFCRLIKYKSRGMDIGPYIKEFPFTTITPNVIHTKQKQQELYSQSENLTKKIQISKFFNSNGRLFGVESYHNYNHDIIWSGDFGYVGVKENFLSQNILTKTIKSDDHQYYSFHVTKNNLTSQMLKIHVKNIIKEKGGLVNYFYYMIWTIPDPETVEFVKEMIKFSVQNLNIKPEERTFYETPILNSAALSAEEKELFNVNNFPHTKYSNIELTNAINQCVSSNEVCFFSPLYPEKCEFINQDNELLIKNFSDDSVDITNYLPEQESDVIIGYAIKNIKAGGENYTLNKIIRAKTVFGIEVIIN